MGSIVVLAASVLVIALNDVFGIDAGLVGLLIIWSTNFSITMGFVVAGMSDSEAAITAIERVDAMSRVPQEKSRTTADRAMVPETWPDRGNLEFENVCLR